MLQIEMQSKYSICLKKALAAAVITKTGKHYSSIKCATLVPEILCITPEIGR